MLVNADNYAYVFRAFCEIDLDNGKVNRLEPIKEEYEVPAPYDLLLPVANVVLSQMSDEEFNMFCCGSAVERQDIQNLPSQYVQTDRLLTAYFNDFVL
ncbi:MAG: hypothetical protein LAP40_20105 [Acidobacteriia bacterium]|nr:hypothetical protein [Terriglobia bacterium]